MEEFSLLSARSQKGLILKDTKRRKLERKNCFLRNCFFTSLDDDLSQLSLYNGFVLVGLRSKKMVKVAHMSDVHLGGWKQKPMQDLNFQSFQKAVEICMKEKVEFLLIAGDLFDTAYPSIEILKETFAEFKKIKDAGIPCFLISGSHDYSVSVKTFLDVLEKAGFCKNVSIYEDDGENLLLKPTRFGSVVLY